MTFNFTEGEPVAAAVQFGTRAFTAATLQNEKLELALSRAVRSPETPRLRWPEPSRKNVTALIIRMKYSEIEGRED
jgi:hypothetical protein